MGLFDIFKSKSVNQEEEQLKVESDFSNFDKVTEYLYERSGIIDLDKRRLSMNELTSFSQQENLHTTEDFLARLKVDHEFYQEVLNIITVNETFFFREMKELEWLVSYIKESVGHYKILSLPCSSGEEVYSILILLEEQGVDLSRVDIVGYDLNTLILQKAYKACYNEHSVHKLSEAQKQRYFLKNSDGVYEVIPRLKERVRFEQNNIFELSGKNEFDIILSRNMFIYFDETKRDSATDIIVNLLKEGGHFIKGHADNIYKHSSLKNVCYGVYKKI